MKIIAPPKPEKPRTSPASAATAIAGMMRRSERAETKVALSGRSITAKPCLAVDSGDGDCAAMPDAAAGFACGGNEGYHRCDGWPFDSHSRHRSRAPPHRLGRDRRCRQPVDL